MSNFIKAQSSKVRDLGVIFYQFLNFDDYIGGVCRSTHCSIERLQKIQNQAAHILTKTPRCDHISEVLVSLHWLRIKQGIIYKNFVLTFKALVDHSAPMYLSELMEKKSSSTNTRSANDDLLLVILPLSRNCSTRSLKDLLTLQHLQSEIN